MNGGTILVLVLLLAILALITRYLIKKRKNKDCGSGCGGCSGCD